MRILLAGPTDTSALQPYLGTDEEVPLSHTFPYLADLAIGYLNLGHEVIVVSLSTHVSQICEFIGSSLSVILVPQRESSRVRSLDFFKCERLSLLKVLQAASVDVVHSHWTYEYSWAALRSRHKTLVTCHDSPHNVLRFYRHPLWFFRESFSAMVLRRADNLTFVSPELKSELRPYTVNAKKKTVVVNGISGSRVTAAARGGVRVPGRPVFAVISNGFDSRKNSAAAIRAFARLLLLLPGARLLLIGQGHEVGGVAQAWAESEGISCERIEYLGRLDNEQVKSLLGHQIDVVVHPSKWEACSIAIMEAQSFGVPVVGNKRARGIQFSLEYGKSGSLIDVRDVDLLAEAMTEVATNGALYSAISSNALSYLRRQFDLTSVISEYLILLEELSKVP